MTQQDVTAQKSEKVEEPKALGKVLVGASLAAVLWFTVFSGDGEDEGVIAGATVKRGDVEITVVERGNLSAKNAASLRSEIEGRATVLSMVPEGTFVEEGDIVCELDTTDEVNKIVEQEIQVQSAEAAFTKARENLEIQQLNNESEIARAETQVTLAGIELNKYTEGDWPQQQQKADEDIVLAETELKQSEEQLGWSRKLHEKGYLTRTELERDELTTQRSRISLEQAQRSKELLVQYEHPKQKVQLEENLKESQRELARVKKEANAEIVDYQFDFKSRETQLELERQQFEKLKDQIEKGVMYAPSSGMVVYGREEGSRWGRGDPVQVGAEVRERQEVISIPSPGEMVAEMSLHESVLSQVQVGLPCRISVDAVPGLRFTGVIDFVSPLPDKNAWFANPNLRLFNTEVAIDDTDSEDANAQASLRELRPGMSCSIEVFVESVPNALYVPLQCVFFKGGKNVCFLKDGSGYVEREVQTGPHNTQIVVIESGVEEGDVVLMSAPLGAMEVEGESDRLPAKSFGGPGAGKSGRPSGGSGAPKAGAPAGGAGQGAAAGGRPSGGAGAPKTGGSAAGASYGGAAKSAGSGGGRPGGKGGGRPQGSGGRSGRPGSGG